MSNDDSTKVPQGEGTPENAAPDTTNQPAQPDAAGVEEPVAPHEPIAPFGNPYQQPEPYTPDPGSLYHAPELTDAAQQTAPTQPYAAPDAAQQPPAAGAPYGQPQQGGTGPVPPYAQSPQGAPQYGGPAQAPQYGGPAQAPQYGAPGQAPQYGGPAQAPQYGAPGQGGPGQGAPYAAAPYPGTPGGSGSAPSKKKLGLILGIGGGALAAIIAIIIAVVAITSSAGGSKTAGGDTGTTKGDGAKTVAKSAEDAVKLYLNAIAKGDADTAIALLDRPGDKSLLTDEVLKASNEAAPITKIKVDPVTDKYFATVDTSYMMGDSEVTTTYRASERNGKWRISGGTIELSLTRGLSGIGATVNGVAVKDGTDSINLFPGAYTLAVTNANFELTGTPEFIVESGDDYRARPEVEVALSADGAAKAQKAVAAAVQACVAEKTLTAGCGLAMPAKLSDGTALTEGSITRVLDGDAQTKLASLKGQPDYANPTKVRMDYIGSVDVSADCAGSPCTVWGSGTSFDTAIVDLSQDPATVTWE